MKGGIAKRRQSIRCVDCFHLVTSLTEEDPAKEVDCSVQLFNIHRSSSFHVDPHAVRPHGGDRRKRGGRCGSGRIKRLVYAVQCVGSSERRLANQSIGNENPRELTRKTFNYNTRRTQAVSAPNPTPSVVLHSLAPASASIVVHGWTPAGSSFCRPRRRTLERASRGSWFVSQFSGLVTGCLQTPSRVDDWVGGWNESVSGIAVQSPFPCRCNSDETSDGSGMPYPAHINARQDYSAAKQ